MVPKAAKDFLADLRYQWVFNLEVTITDSKDLLADYARNGSEAAFRELVNRYIDLVYSTAVRIVSGDSHRAKDIVQVVFIDLARQAPRLPRNIALGGWLHRATCFVSAKMVRTEQRRQNRERQAAEMNALNNAETTATRIAPVLDEAINELSEEDRKAILLRFYEQKDLSAVGEAIGSSENAAQKRVSRAVDQLRVALTSRGVAVSGAALGTILAGEAVTAAPAGLAASVAGPALAGALAGGTSTTLINTLLMSKLKLSLLGLALAAGTGAFLIHQHRANAQLRAEIQQLQANPQEAEPAVTTSADTRSTADPDLPREDQRELLRLRGKISQMNQELLTLRSNPNAQALMWNMISHPFDLSQFPDSYVPMKASLATNAGNATPSALLQTWLWAQRNANAEGLYATCDWPDDTAEAQKQEDVDRRMDAYLRASQSAKQEPSNFEDYQLQSLLSLGDGFYLASFVEWRDPNPQKFVGHQYFRKTQDGWKVTNYRPRQAALLGENPILASEPDR